MSDSALFSTDNIVITRTLAKFPGASYPINSIGSISIRAPKRRSKIIWSAFLAAFGALIIVTSHSPNFMGAFCLVLAAIIGWRAVKSPSTLVLRTASGDTNALQSSNSELLFTIKDAIERATALRG